MNSLVASGLVVLSFFLRFTLPVTVGAFLGALWVFGWPWYGALLFAAPGLLLMVPGLIATLTMSARDGLKSHAASRAQID